MSRASTITATTTKSTWTNSYSRTSSYVSTGSGTSDQNPGSNSSKTTASGTRSFTTIEGFTWTWTSTRTESFEYPDHYYGGTFTESAWVAGIYYPVATYSYSLVGSGYNYVSATRASGYTYTSTNSAGASHTLSATSLITSIQSASGSFTSATTYGAHTTKSARGTFVSKNTVTYSQSVTSSGTGTMGPVLHPTKPKVGSTQIITSWRDTVSASSTGGASTSYYTRRTKRSEKHSTTKSGTFDAIPLPYAASLKLTYSQTRFGTSSIRASRWSYSTKTQKTVTNGTRSTWKNSSTRTSASAYSITQRFTLRESITYKSWRYTTSGSRTRSSGYTQTSTNSAGTTVSKISITGTVTSGTTSSTYTTTSTAIAGTNVSSGTRTSGTTHNANI